VIRLLQVSTLTIFYVLWRLVLWVCLVGCLLLLAAVLLFTHLPTYHAQIEQAIMTTAGYPVQIGRLSTAWRNGRPSLALHDLKVQNPEHRQYLAEIAAAEIEFDLVRSLQQARPIAANIVIHSEQLTLAQTQDGQWHLQKGNSTATSAESAEATAEQLAILLHWLLRQPQVTLAIGQLNWQVYDQAPIQLTDIRLQLAHQANKHWLNTHIQLPAHWGQIVPHGRLHLTSWSEWDMDMAMPRLLNWQGDYQLTEWQFAAMPDETAPQTLALAGAFQISHTPLTETTLTSDADLTAWYLRIQQTLFNPITTANTQSVRLEQKLWAQLSQQGQLQFLQGRLASLDIAAWRPWLNTLAQTYAPAQQPLIAQLQPSGRLDNIHWHYHEHAWQVELEAEQLAIQAVDKIPALQGVSGHMQFNAHQGQFTLASQQVRVHSTRYYSNAHYGEQVQGRFQWQRHADYWRVTTDNTEAKVAQALAQLTGYVDIFTQGQAPKGDFRVSVQNAALAQVHRYIPDRRLAKVSAWLAKALQSGTIEQAELHFQGTLTDVFKNRQDGQFALTGRAQQAKLQYADDWVPVEQISGTVDIHNKHFTFTADHAQLLDTQVRQATVTITDLSDKQTPIAITGQVTGAAEQGLLFLRKSPICEGVGVVNGGLTIAGQMVVDLDMQLILADPDAHVIRGAVQFINTDVTDNSSKLQLTAVNGTLHFDGTQINATDLRGRLFNLPTQLSIYTLNTGKTIEFTRLNLLGKANRQFIRRQLSHLNPLFAKLPIYPYLSGETTWQATLDIPNQPVNLQLAPSYATLDIITDFEGMTLDLPSPFDKPSAYTTKPLRITGHLFTDKTNTIKLDYANAVQAALRIESSGLTKAALAFNTRQSIQLPEQAVFAVEGHVNRADLMTWVQLLTDLAASQDSGSGETLPMQVDLTLAQLDVLGSRFLDVDIAATYQDSWQFVVNSPALSGLINLRHHAGVPSLFMDFKRLYIPLPTSPIMASSNAPHDPTDPRQLPALSLHAADLKLGDISLGTTHLFTHINPDGLVIEEFTTKTQFLQLYSAGRWYYSDAEGHQTGLSATLTSADTGQLLQSLGVEKSAIKGGLLEVALESQWSAPIYHLQPHQLEGKLSLSLQDGHIVDVEPGAVGRMFGLLAVQALPRRLSLDFSDVFAEGFGFESIAGEFTLQAGFAHTDNLMLHGPAAQIHIQGHTDLVEKIYNQKAIVTPHVTNTLPVAGALAGGVGGGALALVVQQILQPELEKAMQYNYQITGPWQQPHVSLISQSVTPQQAVEQVQEQDYEE